MEVKNSDLTVVGGGLAGICAAIAAARNGLTVNLVQDRPILGGNSSSEIRVIINGATGTTGSNNRYAREGGIIEEMVLRNCRNNPSGNPYLWDAMLLDMVAEEAKISLFLNTVVADVNMQSKRKVASVTGHQLMSGKHFLFYSPYFIDASGDGIVAAAGGADYVIGREGKGKYQETFAPEKADLSTNGSSIMFYCQDIGCSAPFVPPAFAYDFRENPPFRLSQLQSVAAGRSCWSWIEFGGQADWDTIKDNEQIASELRAIVYGVWDYIKNSGVIPNTDTLELTWISLIPAKRESRRFLGGYVMTEHDIVNQLSFPDTVAHGGWDIDCHPADGFYANERLCNFFPAGPYEIPYRIIFPRDLDNLWLAGRSISASHIAFGSLRVQMTLGVLGQAAGTAAAIACLSNLTNRQVADSKLACLQETLLKQDQWIIGKANTDKNDLALLAKKITASSTHKFGIAGDTWYDLDCEMALTYPYKTVPRSIQLQLNSDFAQEFDIDIWQPSKLQNYIPEKQCGSYRVYLHQGEQLVTISLVEMTDNFGSVVLCFPQLEGVSILGTTEQLTGVMAAKLAQGGRQLDPTWQIMPWISAFNAQGVSPYLPKNIINGYRRPYGGPNSWCSAPMNSSEWIELEWEEAINIREVHLVFNSDQTPRFVHLGNNPRSMVSLVKSYKIIVGEHQAVVHSESDNFLRVRQHEIGEVLTDRLRIEIEATHGATCAEILEIRVY